MLDGFDPSTIPDPALRQVVQALMNELEVLHANVRARAAEIQRLRDENSRLRGEQDFREATLETYLDTVGQGITAQQRKWIKDALAIAALDDRIRITHDKRRGLLQVLEHPALPLHNNSAELRARQRVRKRAITFGPRTREAGRAWDTFMSLAATSRKLGVNFVQYLHDRIGRANQIPPLATIIDERTNEFDLGASWSPAKLSPPLLSRYAPSVSALLSAESAADRR